MKLDYNLINMITNSNKKEEATTILADYFTDLEGRPVATPTKIRSFVAYPFVKENFTGGDTDTIERAFLEYNKSYNVNDYPFGFVFCGEDGFGFQLIVPINKIELNSNSYTIYLDFGNEYIGKVTIARVTDPETADFRLNEDERILFTPEHTEYQEPEFDDYESEEYINYAKLHIKEYLVVHQIFPRIHEAIESDNHCWFIPYYANNNIESEELTSLRYSKNSPFLPLVFNPENEYLIIQPELPNYIHTNET